MIKYLNNIVEQDHRFIKKKTNQMLGFKSFVTAKSTISGIEIMHMIHKRQVEEIQCVFCEVEFINTIMGMAA
jgi:transposase, IS6 family